MKSQVLYALALLMGMNAFSQDPKIDKAIKEPLKPIRPDTSGGWDGPSNNGDPSQFQLYWRARFGVMELRVHPAIEQKLIDILEEAVDTLVIELDPTLPVMTRVKEDPNRQGKRVMFVNPELFRQNYDHRHEGFDLTQSAVHETFQTKMKDAKVAYDTDEEITKHLSFSETKFEQFLERQALSFGGSKVPTRLLPGSYVTPEGGWNYGWQTPLRLTYDRETEEYTVGNALYRNDGHEFSRTTNSSGQITLKPAQLPSGKWIYLPKESLTYKATNTCPFSYQLEIFPREDGFGLRERFPRSISINRAGYCVYDYNDWNKHYSGYELDFASYHQSYQAAIDRTLDTGRKNELRLFLAATTNNAAEVKRLLENEVNPMARDWHQRIPLMMAAKHLAWDAFMLLLPKTELSVEDDRKRNIAYFILSRACEGCSNNSEIRKKMFRAVFAQKIPDWLDQAARWSAEAQDRFDLLEEVMALGPSHSGREIAFRILVDHTGSKMPEAPADKLLLKFVSAGYSKGIQANWIGRLLTKRNEALFWKLAEAGEPVDREDGEGSNLKFATERHMLLTAKRLVEEYKVKTQFNDGTTALAIAIVKSDLEMSAILVPHTNLALIAGELKGAHLVFAASLALDKDKFPTQIMELMLNKDKTEADVKATDSTGRTPLDYFSKAIQKVTNNFRHTYPQDKRFIYLKDSYLWLRNTHKAPLAKEPAVPDHVLYGFQSQPPTSGPYFVR